MLCFWIEMIISKYPQTCITYYFTWQWNKNMIQYICNGSLLGIFTGPGVRSGPCSFSAQITLLLQLFCPWLDEGLCCCCVVNWFTWRCNGRLRDMPTFRKGKVRLVTSVFTKIKKVRVSESEQSFKSCV